MMVINLAAFVVCGFVSVVAYENGDRAISAGLASLAFLNLVFVIAKLV